METMESNSLESVQLRNDKEWKYSRDELICAILMYPMTYCYIQFLFTVGHYWNWLAGFAVLFVLMGEYLFRNEPRTAESWVWLGCMAVILLRIVLPCEEPVWEQDISAFFLHVFAIYWVLCRSGRLVEGVSGKLLPTDAFCGVILFPFKHFFARIRTVFCGLKQIFRKNHGPAVLWSAVAVVVSLALLVIALNNLAQTDANYLGIMTKFTDMLDNLLPPDAWARFVLSLPIGAWLFGLLAGTRMESIESVRNRGERILRVESQLRKVPETVWILVICAFSAFYLVYFALQGSYLFGAFIRKLPEGFVVSQYAREGFFELCRASAVTFAMLWLAAYTGVRDLSGNKILRIMCTVLCFENMLFAVIAASKIGLYISCFGFTPKRLQSAWLTGVLFAGCLLTGVRILTGKKTARIWVLFSGISLALLHLYGGFIIG